MRIIISLSRQTSCEMADFTTSISCLAALIARPSELEDSSRIGCPLPPDTIIGKPPEADSPDSDVPPPPYNTLDSPRVPDTSELNENPLWQLVQSDLSRNQSDDQLQRVRDVGRKLIISMYFPLLNDFVRFVWSLSQVIILFIIMVVQLLVVCGPFRSNNSKANATLADAHANVTLANIASLSMGVIAAIIALLDCIACTTYFLHKKYYKNVRTPDEEEPLLGVGVRWVQWTALANWWHKYNDIPRFKVFEALYVVIYYLEFAAFRLNDNYISLGVALAAISLLGVTLLLQAGILVKIAYFTYYQRHHGVSYKAFGLLVAFVIHFIALYLYFVLLLAFSSYIFGHYGVPYILNSNGVIFTGFALVFGLISVPLFSHLTFFTMFYGWFKYAYTKTFIEFLSYLNNLRLNGASLQERKSIKFVLDKYHYEALITPPCTWNKTASYLPGCVQILVLGLLLTLLLCSVSVALANMCYIAIFFHRFDLFVMFLTFTLLLHILYIVAAIVWLLYTVIDILGWCCYKCGQ